MNHPVVRRLITISALALMALVVVAVLYAAVVRSLPPYTHLEKVRAKLTDALPRGSSLESVLAYLSDNNIESAPPLEAASYADLDGSVPARALVVRAVIRDAYDNGITLNKTDVVIYFVLDDDKLDEIVVMEDLNATSWKTHNRLASRRATWRARSVAKLRD